MKTKLLILCLGLFSYVAYCQDTIPNYNFETWTTQDGYQTPNGWVAMKASFGSPVYWDSILVTKSTNSYFDNFAVCVRNIINSTDTVKGLVTTKNLSTPYPQPKPCFPITTRHTSLTGYYNFLPENGDSCSIMVVFFKTGFSGPLPNLLAYGIMRASSTSSYSPFNVEMYYLNSTEIPDSAYIGIMSYGGMSIDTSFQNIFEYKPLGNSIMYVDGLNFDNLLLNVNTLEKSIKDIEIYPNPTTKYLYVRIDGLVNDNYVAQVSSLDGKLLKTENLKITNGENIQMLNIESLKAGTYIYTISSHKGYFSKKFNKN